MKYLMSKKIDNKKEDVSGYSLENGPLMGHECTDCVSTCSTGCTSCDNTCYGSCHGEIQRY